MSTTASVPQVDRRVLRALWGTNRLTGRPLAEVRRLAGLESTEAWAQLGRACRYGYARKGYSGVFGGTTYWLTDEGRAHLDAPN